LYIKSLDSYIGFSSFLTLEFECIAQLLVQVLFVSFVVPGLPGEVSPVCETPFHQSRHIILRSLSLRRLLTIFGAVSYRRTYHQPNFTGCGINDCVRLQRFPYSKTRFQELNIVFACRGFLGFHPPELNIVFAYRGFRFTICSCESSFPEDSSF
jgi:hypothetical protein